MWLVSEQNNGLIHLVVSFHFGLHIMRRGNINLHIIMELQWMIFVLLLYFVDLTLQSHKDDMWDKLLSKYWYDYIQIITYLTMIYISILMYIYRCENQ